MLKWWVFQNTNSYFIYSAIVIMSFCAIWRKGHLFGIIEAYLLDLGLSGFSLLMQLCLLLLCVSRARKKWLLGIMKLVSCFYYVSHIFSFLSTHNLHLLMWAHRLMFRYGAWHIVDLTQGPTWLIQSCHPNTPFPLYVIGLMDFTPIWMD